MAMAMAMEETSLAELVSSLPVPSVQEIAKEAQINNTKTVPQRYIRPDLDPPFISHPPTCLPQVPVIDMNKLLSSEALLMESELQKLHLASQEWGFFQLINHGVSGSVVEGVKVGVKELFNLPMEEKKKKFWQRAGDMEGFGQAFVVSEDQKLDWADVFHLITLPKSVRRPHLLPQFPLHFRECIETYSTELEKVSKTILGLMEKALGMEGSEMKELFDGGGQTMRMNYYPSCPQPDVVIGLNPHSDATGITVLLQLNDTQGLQIRKDGAWLPIKPLPNAFIVNIGDVLEILTNGIYRSVEHRATVNIAAERLSVATFHNPKINGDLGPAPSLIGPETPPLFRRISVSDYFKGYFSRQLQGRSYMDVIRINNEENKTTGQE